MKTTSYFLLILVIVVIPLYTNAQDTHKTITATNATVSPKADLSAIEWLAGHWRGEAFGGVVEELWSPPFGGSMMASFRLIVDGKVNFYELETIVEENETLILRLKHFHADLKGWETKDETVDFPLVKVEEGKVYFSGFTIERVNEDAINMYVNIGEGDKVSEVTFNYQRVKG